MSEPVAEVRELRSQVRHWRRGRADAKLTEVLQDAYVALFSTALLGSMVVNVVLNLGRLSDTCASRGCGAGRTVLPWATVLAALLAVVVLGRLFGPVYSSPAVSSWLLPSPLDRGALLRPRLLATLAVGGAAGATLTALGFALVSVVGLPLLVLALVGGLLAAAALALLVATQAAGAPGERAAAAGQGVVAAGLVGLLLALALGVVPALEPVRRLPGWAWPAVLGLAVLVAAAAGRAVRRLPSMRLTALAPGGSLAPGLSGALANLDLALVHDVVLGHRWRRRATVVPRRGGPTGPLALVHRDLLRLRRSPASLLRVVAVVVVPWAAAASGAGRLSVVVAVLVGFLVALPLLTGLRVLTRSVAMARSLPFPPSVSRAAHLVVPLAVLTAYGLATGPATHVAGGSVRDTVLLGLAIGAGATAAAARWVTGRPPDYSRPLVSTPAGGVPTNLYGSALRGFDVVLLTSLPVLVAPAPTGETLSLLASAAVVGYLVARR